MCNGCAAGHDMPGGHSVDGVWNDVGVQYAWVIGDLGADASVLLSKPVCGQTDRLIGHPMRSDGSVRRATCCDPMAPLEPALRVVIIHTESHNRASRDCPSQQASQFCSCFQSHGQPLYQIPSCRWQQPWLLGGSQAASTKRFREQVNSNQLNYVISTSVVIMVDG